MALAPYLQLFSCHRLNLRMTRQFLAELHLRHEAKHFNGYILKPLHPKSFKKNSCHNSPLPQQSQHFSPQRNLLYNFSRRFGSHVLWVPGTASEFACSSWILDSPSSHLCGSASCSTSEEGTSINLPAT